MLVLSFLLKYHGKSDGQYSQSPRHLYLMAPALSRGQPPSTEKHSQERIVGLQPAVYLMKRTLRNP